MGMFDYIKFEKSPVQCKCGHKLTEFQTKDWDNSLAEHVITENGCLREGWKRAKKDGSKSKRYRYFNDLVDTLHCYTSCHKCGKYWFDLAVVFIDGRIREIKKHISKLQEEKE